MSQGIDFGRLTISWLLIAWMTAFTLVRVARRADAGAPVAGGG